MNVNEALLIDRLERQISDALHGSYHHSGSARSGDVHNGEKHILFTRDGDPNDQLCVVLRNGGWDSHDTLTEVDVHVVSDHKVNEKKRRIIRNRIADYINASYAGGKTTLHCVSGTEQNVTTNHPAAANLKSVKKQTPRRRKRTAR